MPDTSMTIEQVLTRLAATPPRFATLTASLTPAQLQQRPETDAWSANEVLAHLRAGADVWGLYIARILAEDRPTFRAISPRTWMKRTNYLELDFEPSLHAFATQRTELLAVLEPLSSDGWSRGATVKQAGRVIEPTVLWYAERLARHEGAHIAQVEQIVEAVCA